MKYLLILLLIIPAVDAYSLSDFVDDTQNFLKDYLELTGAIVFKLTEKSTDIGTTNLEEICPRDSIDLTIQKTCKDTDLFNFKNKGMCKSKTQKLQDYCSEDKEMVMEFSCSEEDLCVGSWRICEEGCEEGACVDS